MTPLYAGLDIGGTKTLAGLVAPDGAVVARARAATPAKAGPVAVLDSAARLIRSLMAERSITALGVGAAGTFDAGRRTVRYATDSLSGWVGTEVADELSRRLTIPVTVDNDVNAALLGESWCGAARGHDDVLLVAVGTGVGGALLQGGRIRHGRSGAAGEIGHLPAMDTDGSRCGCGRVGHLEGVASGNGIAARYTARTGRPVGGAADVVDLASTGDAAAALVLQWASEALGRAIAGLSALLDPDVVVLGGGLGTTPTFSAAVRSAFLHDRLPFVEHVDIRTAGLGDDSVVVGAARMTIHEEAATVGAER